MIEQIVVPLLQQRMDFSLIAQRKSKSHRQHADSTMDRIKDSSMEHRGDGLVRRVDEGTR